MRAGSKLKELARWLRRMPGRMGGGMPASSVPARWLRKPAIVPGGRLCVIVLLARDGCVLPHGLAHALAWRDGGYDVLAVVVLDTLDQPFDAAPLDFAGGLLLRVNSGYDFGAWAAAIRGLGPSLRELDALVITNDSVLGPSDRFGAMLERIDCSPAGLIGLTECTEFNPHLQSYLLVFKPLALRSAAFDRFWANVRSGDRRFVIDNYEIALQGRFERAGVSSAALFPVPVGPFDNPTLSHWRELLAAGFPFVKVQLLRINPREVSLSDWRTVLSAAGFDLVRVEHQLAALMRPEDPAWAVTRAET